MENSRTRFGTFQLLLGGLLLVTTVAALAAQPVPEAIPPAEDDCQLESLGEAGETPSSNTGEGPADDSLTAALDPCNGVLAPPTVGDGELTIPPPAGGETPVIRPRQLPEQQP